MNTIRVIGSGSYGIVKELNTASGTVARKELLLTQDDAENIKLKRRFRREVEYQAQLSHRNVVSILDSDLTCETPWFTMPLAICSLGNEASNGIRMTDTMKVFAFRMIMNGVEYIHQSGQIHRDLKPDNILRFATSYRHYVYAVSDFGLVAGVGGNNTTALTMTNTAMGTINYMPFECYQDAKRATEQSDIYSMGVILKFILDGSYGVPFAERTSTSIFSRIISKCTKENPRARYANVGELRKDFEECYARSGFQL